MGLDYDAINESLSFESGTIPGINDKECFSFLPIDDTLDEFLEDIVVIQAASNNPDVQFTQGGNESQIHIVDNDSEWSETMSRVLGGIDSYCRYVMQAVKGVWHKDLVGIIL